MAVGVGKDMRVIARRFSLLRGLSRPIRGLNHCYPASVSPARPAASTSRGLEFFNETACDSIEELQAALDAWVVHYNTERPHQGIGDVVPA